MKDLLKILLPEVPAVEFTEGCLLVFSMFPCLCYKRGMLALRGLIVLIFFLNLVFGDDFPELPNTESTTDADPPSAEESAKSFSLPDGYGVSVWAGEPAVQNPIGMAWDHKGRMWVAENYTYGSRKVRFDLSLRDRVIVLADEDGDGEAETRKVLPTRCRC